MSDYDYIVMRHREKMRESFRAIDNCNGFVPDLPHPYTHGGFMESGPLCIVCGGHSDRRLHDSPWQRPVFAACKTCADHPGIECDVCGETRRSLERIGVVETRRPEPPKEYSRSRIFMGRRWKRRKGHWRRQEAPRATQKQALRGEYR